ncbi:DUF309 domain-containing protein [Paenibacillus nasutitermitis]|uniref:DUF309 domain-containing protein n=1 Tax=Paenibacillus nasutitermitis TaxID=1652958 RepID=A0A916YPA3_9BACL|nr:DUF309 domain-containing protein [Paenibacillus nasutitermitis]GGD55230.1 hypothetical protein GCM10010911_11130 [Paenibacillus nasutitermitis]
MADEMRYDERLVHFIVLFNVDEDYFECHEVMEELWLEEGRNTLYQGLLQAAVGLHHWRNDNFSGAVKLFAQAENKLAPYPPILLGLDLAMLRHDIAVVLAPLRIWVNGGGSLTGRISAPGEGSMEEENGHAEAHAPPPFTAFRLTVVDQELLALVEEMSQIPHEDRLHAGDDS